MKRTKKIPTATRERVYMVRTALVLVIIALFFAIGGGIFYVRNQPTMRTYTSDFMKIQFDYPQSYVVEERYTSGSITDKTTQSAKLKFGRYGTNFASAIEYTRDLVKLNNVQVKSITNFQSQYSAVVLEANVDGRLERSYFFVNNYAIYYFSTNDPSLFSDLDAIAKSFRILE